MIATYVGIGSNIDRHNHIESALAELKRLGKGVTLSTIYECEAIGFKGQPFYNLVVEFQTQLSLQQLASELRDIELRLGRTVDAQKFQPRTIDLDIILYGDICSKQKPELPRSDIYRYPFVIQPLYELCPELIIPNDGRSIRDVWSQAKDLDVLNAIEPWFDLTIIE
ncbi:2-amino-4-hydroxy-6-hydroxymethyldihydropteridine diphosphokinase [Vibrio nitrifigilis]|uniref:2-amino-4-hydroxy-6-hydroxymethyldihydropteridine diphosphokinase n=1 Tax=Vibrio nitrifigilis TaxID=2789781 RepID=A0ABS0GGJ8_9VIBR|nr:2-amino-4-hydroxy-6-hydroxymethyldihydropteridine diphosphokinase [Vibrio nitrifigilis]MBF9001460.1 2-amino-4-hydroxy-6-hydroxymethyldihydropteridine diphosphokinase [Vibrio nitrifigilis]